MQHKTDIEIAQAAALRDIRDIAGDAGIDECHLELYGNYKAKVGFGCWPGEGSTQAAPGGQRGKLVLVTAITPTPAGEGKTTTTVGLADALRRIGKRSSVALREPSLGPVFGMKGGATGGGHAQVLPMEDINLHFTGDLHAVGAANNLLAAMLDNHIHQGNALGIDARRVTWRRAMDMNDRQLRVIVGGLGGRANGAPREDGFDITAASEAMAALCLADGLEDLKGRLSRIVVGFTAAGAGTPVTAGDLKAAGAMASLLRDAIKPNLVQTLEGTPALIHGGPFANIAHGCSSVIATRLALRIGDYAVTEAGFGADLGAEKFVDIKCRMSGLAPNAVVIVATVRALKLHGGAAKDALGFEDLAALERGLPNLMQHVENITGVFKLPAVVAINRFPTDTEAELALVEGRCRDAGVRAALSEVWAKGGEGGMDLAREVVRLCEPHEDGLAKGRGQAHEAIPACSSGITPAGEAVQTDGLAPTGPAFAYPLDAPIESKLGMIARKVYRADGVELSAEASRQAARLESLGFGGLPICVAKTQYSFSDNPSLLGAPRGFIITVRNLKVSAGAGFVVAMTGEIMAMPGLPRSPSAERIDVDGAGRITGLF